MAEKVIKKTRSTSSVQAVKKSTAKAVQAPKAAKPAVKAVLKTEKEPKTVNSSLTIAVVDTDGKAAGSMKLPESVFGAKVNKNLMAQAVRVYLANQRQGNASTKSRGEVDGSTRKIYRQKGTGRARHGGVRAPIFVKGGIAHGPKPRDYSLSLPTKMRRAALFSALTAQLASENIIVVTGLEKLGAKTKPMAASLAKVAGVKTLVVMPEHTQEIYKAARNIMGVSLTTAGQLTTYDVLQAKKVVFMKDAIAKVEKGAQNDSK